MKYFFFLCAILLCSCGECDKSSYYQIRFKDPEATSAKMSRYGVEGLGPCTTWQKTQQVFFRDSTRKYSLSQILSRAQVERYSSSGSGN